MKYFFHDFETGGYENSSILTFYGVVTDQNFNKIDDIELWIKPDNGLYMVEAQALRVNKIDLLAHDKEAQKESVCKDKIRAFIEHFAGGGSEKLYMAGHNVYFDNRLLKDHFFPDDFNKMFFRHNLDTGTLALLLKQVGKLPKDLEISLSNLATHYGLNALGAHESKTDVWLTIGVLKCMIKEINGSDGQK